MFYLKWTGNENSSNRAPPIPPFPSSHLYSSASCLPSSFTSSLATESISMIKEPKSRLKTDSYCSTEQLATENSENCRISDPQPTRFASQDLLNSETYQDKVRYF